MQISNTFTELAFLTNQVVSEYLGSFINSDGLVTIDEIERFINEELPILSNHEDRRIATRIMWTFRDMVEDSIDDEDETLPTECQAASYISIIESQGE